MIDSEIISYYERDEKDKELQENSQENYGRRGNKEDYYGLGGEHWFTKRSCSSFGW